MTRSLTIAGTAFALATGLIAAQPSVKKNGDGGSELIVKFRANASDTEVEHGFRQARLKLKKHVRSKAMVNRGEPGLILVETEESPELAIEKLKTNPGVEYAEPNHTYTHRLSANDPYVTGGHLWGAYGDLSTPANAFGSQAAEAWTAGHVGSRQVYVAVIDEGVQVTHPDLAPNIWMNPFDPADGIDNDQNGYVDDVHGWDFHANTNQLYDAVAGDTHGTHVAGTIGAKGGNGAGIAGVNWDVTIIPGKFMSGGSGSTLDAVEAIEYYIDLKERHGLNIVAINASWGGAGYSRTLHDSIIRAAKAGILFVAAAGNEALNNDSSASYPANLSTLTATASESAASYNGVISVAAIDSKGALATFSNYGASRVHIGAPGVNILSTYPGGYAYMNGTSMATPHVAGAVALYASTHPNATAAQIRDALLTSVIATPSLTGKVSTGGRLNLSSIVTPTPILPNTPQGLSATAGNANVALAWYASEGATEYVVQRGAAATGPFQQIATVGSLVSYIDYAVANGTTYYYAVAAKNAAGTSTFSAVVAATPKAPVALPTAPTGVRPRTTLSRVSGSADVTVTWTAVSGAATYKVKRGKAAAGPFTTVGTVSGTSFIEALAASTTSYYYVVSAVNAAGESANSMAAGIFVMLPVPALYVPVATSSTTVELKWQDRSLDEDGFVFYYHNGVTWVQFATTPANTTTLNVSGLLPNTRYVFRVRAYKGTVFTGYSSNGTVTTPL